MELWLTMIFETLLWKMSENWEKYPEYFDVNQFYKVWKYFSNRQSGDFREYANIKG